MLYIIIASLIMISASAVLICTTAKADKLGKFYIVLMVILSLLLTLGIGHGLGFKNGQIEYAKGNIQFERTIIDKWVAE